MSELARRLAENLAAVRGRIAAAAAESGRTADSVRLVAVTKYVDVTLAAALVDAGCHDLGESRPQEMWRKAAALPNETRWHLIGHLQRNKIRRTLPLVHLLHSVDSPRLLDALDAEAALLGRTVAALVEVNVSGDPSKTGLAPEALDSLLTSAAAKPHVSLQGLMCMAALDGGLDRARRDFAMLRELRDRARANCPPRISLDELSMGMSDDFEAAIAQGATIVRVGSALFEGVAS
jgi:pyridoxal phosphate enzyme (YggS family)